MSESSVQSAPVQFGNWRFETVDASRCIFPKDARTGKSMRVSLPKAICIMRSVSVDSTVSFSKYRTQGKWFYRDSRRKEPVSRFHVVSEIARMACVGPAKAELIVDTFLPV